MRALTTRKARCTPSQEPPQDWVVYYSHMVELLFSRHKNVTRPTAVKI
jgi:hypothetical protein